MKKTIASIAAAIFTLAVTAPASARSCGGVDSADTVDVAGTTLRLNGMGVREATVFNVDVYVASLYVAQVSTDANAILSSDAPKRIILHFVHEVSRNQMVEAFTEGFQKNSPGVDQAKKTQLLGWVGNMAVGQEVVITYVPGRGTEYRANGQVKGTIDGADFARAVFSLFIGSHPPNRGLKVGLLGGRCG